MKTWLEKKDGMVFSDVPVKDVFSNLPDGLYEMELIRSKNQRSSAQNRLLHKWLTELSNKSHVGYVAVEWKEIFRSMFLKEEYESTMGTMVRVKSTSELDTKQFSEFLEKIRAAALTKEVGPIQLKYPGEVTFEQWCASVDSME